MPNQRLDELDVLQEEYITWLQNHPNAPHEEWKEIQLKLNKVLLEKNELLKSITEKIKDK